MLNWIEIDDQTQQRMIEVKRLYETGFHEEVLRDPYEEYLDKAKELLDMTNNGTISTIQYIFDIQLLMERYKTPIEERREKLKRSA